MKGKIDSRVFATIVSADNLKQTIPGYDPSQAEKFHLRSAHLADHEYASLLKNSHYTRVILLSGGSASGKTEFMMTQLLRKRAIIVDTTLPSTLGAKIKIEKAHKLGKQVVIYSVIPDKLKRAFIAFLGRDRIFSPDHFYRTHSAARKTLLWVARNYPSVDIHLIESHYGKDKKVTFSQLQFPSRESLITYLVDFQLSENDIINSTI